MSKNRIIPQMFDVRPVDQTGDLDWNKIESVGLKQKKTEAANDLNFEKLSANAYCLGVPVDCQKLPIYHDPQFSLTKKNPEVISAKENEASIIKKRLIEERLRIKKEKDQLRASQLQLQQEIILKREEARLKLEQEMESRRLKLEKELLAQKERREIERNEMIKQQLIKQQQEEALRLDKEKQLREERERINKLLLEEKNRKDVERKEFLAAEIARMKDEQMALSQKIAAQNEEIKNEILNEKLRLQQQKEQQMNEQSAKIASERMRIFELSQKERQEREAAILEERRIREKQHQQWLAEENKRIAEEKKLQDKAEKASKSLQKRIDRKRAIVGFFSALKTSKKNSNRKRENNSSIFSDAISSVSGQFNAKRFVPAFAALAMLLFFGVGTVSFASKGFAAKGRVLGVSSDGYANLSAAIAQMKVQNFDGSAQQFSQAFEKFSQASDDLEELGGSMLDATRYLPFASKVSSGKNAVEAGKHFSAAGKSLNNVVKQFKTLKDSGGQAMQGEVSLLEMFKSAEGDINAAKIELDAAQKNIDLISIDDLPADKQQKFLLLKQALPELRSAMDTFLNNSHIFIELLGGNGPRKYLFLFQNNTEIRPTGGFIGSYGLLDIANGHVKKFFIDGIFNPDGQLKDKVVPPMPIQKISAAWSLHDSNWFPDFPMSAQKAIQFYEKTGGPTADGVISFTPTLMQKLLKITGPIEMPDYGVTLDADNFIQLTQYKVEVDYDKQENKPKKILSDLAPLLLEKLLSSNDLEKITKTAQAFSEGLSEKHILLYSQDKELQSIISAQGWSGEILPSSRDYLNVINTNINGYKTDAVIKESIVHNAEIQDDGSVIDTVEIIRKHEGGSSQYEWLNKVNADYMRVYVPKGSKLLEASGQTREVQESPLDYDSLGFERDVDVVAEESRIVVDPYSGTRMYDEKDKTVFANWVYVSPQETVKVRYKYLLPFRLFQVKIGNSQQIDTYSLLIQKQSGSVGSELSSKITFPEKYENKWSYPESLKKDSGFTNETKLVTDIFEGIVFENKGS